MGEFKAGKERAIDLLGSIPQVIPHRKVDSNCCVTYTQVAVDVANKTYTN